MDTSFDSRGFVAFDFDHDGDNDIVVSSRQKAVLYVNHWVDWNRNGWLKVRLEGGDGVVPEGAMVKVAANGRVEARPYVTENSYASSYAGPLLFGLGKAERVESIDVVWPGGGTSRLTDVPANQEIVIRPTDAGATPAAG